MQNREGSYKGTGKVIAEFHSTIPSASKSGKSRVLLSEKQNQSNSKVRLFNRSLHKVIAVSGRKIADKKLWINHLYFPNTDLEQSV